MVHGGGVCDGRASKEDMGCSTCRCWGGRSHHSSCIFAIVRPQRSRSFVIAAFCFSFAAYLLGAFKARL